MYLELHQEVLAVRTCPEPFTAADLFPGVMWGQHRGVGPGTAVLARFSFAVPVLHHGVVGFGFGFVFYDP